MRWDYFVFCAALARDSVVDFSYWWRVSVGQDVMNCRGRPGILMRKKEKKKEKREKTEKKKKKKEKKKELIPNHLHQSGIYFNDQDANVLLALYRHSGNTPRGTLPRCDQQRVSLCGYLGSQTLSSRSGQGARLFDNNWYDRGYRVCDSTLIFFAFGSVYCLPRSWNQKQIPNNLDHSWNLKKKIPKKKRRKEIHNIR